MWLSDSEIDRNFEKTNLKNPRNLTLLKFLLDSLRAVSGSKFCYAKNNEFGWNVGA